MSRQYLFTERAHLMCPNMYFGIVETLDGPFDPMRIACVLDKLSKAHPFLRAVLGYKAEGNQYYYDIGNESKIQSLCKEKEIFSIHDRTIFEEYKRLTKRDWDLFQEGMLKTVCWKMKNKTCVLFVFHHLQADGRAALNLAIEFARLYVKNMEPAIAVEKLISSIRDLPAESKLPIISRMLIEKCNKNWKKEKQVVTYDEYHKFADSFLQKDDITHSVQVYEQKDVEQMITMCRKNAVSVNDFLLTKMFIEETTDKIIIAQDIRDKLNCYQKGALGNYSTAFSVVCKVKSDDIFKEAKRVHKAVKKNASHLQTVMTVLLCYAQMDPGLLDVAAISTLGEFSSRTGAFVGSNMFGFKSENGHSITNLGKYEENTIENAMFIPPASPAIRKTWGVLTMNGQMAICTSERN